MKWPILLAAALGLAVAGAAAAPAPAPSAPAAKPFAPTRFSVVVQGTGPDVILIPGLTGSRDVWKGSVAAVPGYRYHLVQVAGFANTPRRAAMPRAMSSRRWPRRSRATSARAGFAGRPSSAIRWAARWR